MGPGHNIPNHYLEQESMLLYCLQGSKKLKRDHTVDQAAIVVCTKPVSFCLTSLEISKVERKSDIQGLNQVILNEVA